MTTKIHGVKGMNDLLPPEIEIWHRLEDKARSWMRRYGYREVRTPILEDTSLFVRSVGEETDIVGKEMYTFEDRGNRSLSMRPEGTAPLVRAYLEHSVFNQEPVTHWYYLGPMFRYERMKTGRYRQFWQLGAEAYGAKEPAQDVELIELAMRLLGELGLSDVRLHLNSLGDDACRPGFEQKLKEHFVAHREQLCPDCQSRLERNPLRVLDCKERGCQKVAKGVPRMVEMLCDPCRAHFEETQRLLSQFGVRFEIDPRLVRGLDYYTRTAFEFIAEDPILGTASAVGGGGRYDKLVENLGGPSIPGVGWAMGMDRLCLLMGQRAAVVPGRPDLFVAWIGDAARDRALGLVSELRAGAAWVEFDPRGGSLKSQMKRADKSGARFALVIGDAELERAAGKLKPLDGGEPREVAFAHLAPFLRGG